MLLRYAGQVLGVIGALAAGAAGGGSMDIYQAEVRKTSPFDPGTLQIILRNRGSADAQVAEVLLNDLAIPVWGVGYVEPPVNTTGGVDLTAQTRHAGRQIVWASLDPPIIARRGLSLLRVKLAEPLRARAKIDLKLSDGNALKAVFPVPAPGPRFTAITFAPDLAEVCCFLSNQGDSPLGLGDIEVDGAPVQGHPWFSSHQMGPGERAVVVVALGQPLSPGTFHVFRLSDGKGRAIAERVRAFAAFPLTVEDGRPPAEYGFDASPFCYRPGYLLTNGEHAQPLPVVGASIHLYDCPMHTYGGNLQQSARELFRRRSLAAEQNPLLPTSIHICRVCPEEGCAKFGEIADILHFNPNTHPGPPNAPRGETSARRAASMLSCASLGAAPRPVHSLVAVTENGDSLSPGETRRLAYTIVAEGAKGLIYRYTDWNDARQTALHTEIQRLNQELRRLIPFLTMADVFPLVAESPPGLSAYTLVNPDEGIVLVVVNEGDAAADANVDLRLAIPSWLTPRKLSLVTPDGLADLPVDGAALAAGKLTIPRPAVAAAYVVHGARRDSGTK